MTFAKILTQTDPKLGPAGLILEFTGEPQRTAPVCRVFREYAEKQYETLCKAYARDPYLKAYLPEPGPQQTSAARVGEFYTKIMAKARKNDMQLPELVTDPLSLARLAELSKARDIWNFFEEVARRLPAAQQFVNTLQGNLVTKAQAITAWMDQHQDELGTVRSLNFEGKNLSHLPQQIGLFHGLLHLKLRQNDLTTLPPELGNCTQLSSLNLTYNHLSEIPREIGLLTELRDLMIAYNLLTEIPVEIGDCSQLRRLSLHNNRLTSIPAAVGNCTQLDDINLSRNRLTQIPAQLGNCTRLYDIQLHHNLLSQIPAEIGNCTQLKRLSLHYNHLRTMPSEIGNCIHLEWLELHINLLDSLPQELDRCAALRYLSLNPNHNLNLTPRISALVHTDAHLLEIRDEALFEIADPQRMYELLHEHLMNPLHAALAVPLVLHEPTLWECICEIATLIMEWIAEKIGALVRALTQPFNS